MNCHYCQREFTPTNGKHRFCSTQCAADRKKKSLGLSTDPPACHRCHTAIQSKTNLFRRGFCQQCIDHYIAFTANGTCLICAATLPPRRLKYCSPEHAAIGKRLQRLVHNIQHPSRRDHYAKNRITYINAHSDDISKKQICRQLHAKAKSAAENDPDSLFLSPDFLQQYLGFNCSRAPKREE